MYRTVASTARWPRGGGGEGGRKVVVISKEEEEGQEERKKTEQAKVTHSKILTPEKEAIDEKYHFFSQHTYEYQNARYASCAHNSKLAVCFLVGHLNVARLAHRSMCRHRGPPHSSTYYSTVALSTAIVIFQSAPVKPHDALALSALPYVYCMYGIYSQHTHALPSHKLFRPPFRIYTKV